MIPLPTLHARAIAAWHARRLIRQRKSGTNMSAIRDVAVIVGSLRKESLNRKLANALIELVPPSLKLAIVEIGALPLYNADYDEADVPVAYTAFRERMHRATGVIFVTPEYNRSMPAPLKNALDVGSRPYGKSVWSGKPTAVVSGSPGAIGGFGANHHLRQSFVFLDMPAMQQPEAYIGGADKLFDESGRLTNESTRGFLGEFMRAYAAWLERNMPQ
jgi:chromate reductase